MIDMIVGESGHGEITVIVTLLPADIHFALFSLGGFGEVFGEELALVVEVVGCALFIVPLSFIGLFFSFKRINLTKKKGGGER